MAYGDLNKYMDTAAETGSIPVRKHHIQPEYGDEQANAGRYCRTHLASQIFRRERGQGNIHFPCSANQEQDWQSYPMIHTLAICVTIQYNGCTRHGPNRTSTPFFTPYTGTHHMTCASLPRHQMRAYANRLLCLDRTVRALHTRTYTHERTIGTTVQVQIQALTSTRCSAQRPSFAHENIRTRSYDRYTCTRKRRSTHVHQVHRAQAEL